MNQHLQTILNFIQSNESLTDEEKSSLLKSLNDAGSELDVALSELGRTEKLKKNQRGIIKKSC